MYWAGPDSYRKLRDLGARIIVSNFGNDTEVRLYWAARTGIKLILFNSAWIDDSVPGGRANTELICKNASEFWDHPGLWGYYLVDEPSKHVYPSGARNPVSVSTMQAVNQAVKRCDPNHPTLAVFLPGGGFGTSSNNFGAGIADYVMFDLYPKAPGNAWHPEWITNAPLPGAIDVVRERDRSAKIWMAVQAFGGCTSSGCFSSTNEDQIRQQIDLNFDLFKRKGVTLDGLFFFLWDHKFDDDYSRVTDDMRSHPDFWKLIDHARDKLPTAGRVPAAPILPAGTGDVTGIDPHATISRPGVPTSPAGDSLCTEFTPQGAIEGVITQVDRSGVDVFRVDVGGRSFRVDPATTSVVEFSASQGALGPDYLQPGATVKAFARDRSNLGERPACKVLVKAVANLKFETLAREEIENGGVRLTVKSADGAASGVYRTVEVNGALPTDLGFAAPNGQPGLAVGQQNLQAGSLLQVKLGFVGGSPTNLRATALSVLPLNGGLFLVAGPAGRSGTALSQWTVESLTTPKQRFRTVTVDPNAAVYFSGKNASGKNVNIRLGRVAVQPGGLYTFLGAAEGAPHQLRANVAYQVPQNFWGIVTSVKNGGRTLDVMGPGLPDPDNTQFTMLMGRARIYHQLDTSRPETSVGSVSPYSTALFTGFFVGKNTFKVTQAVFYWMAPPAPR